MTKMKKIIAIITFVLLSGCSAFSAYNTPPTFNYEYERITNIRTEAEFAHEKCPDVNPFWMLTSALGLRSDAALLQSYAEGMDNKSVSDMSEALYNQISNFYDKTKDTSKPISKAYCLDETQNIYDNATTIQKIIGKGLKQ